MILITEQIVRNNCFTNLKLRPYRDLFFHDFIRLQRIFLDLKHCFVEVVYLELNFSVGSLSRKEIVLGTAVLGKGPFCDVFGTVLFSYGPLVWFYRARQ